MGFHKTYWHNVVIRLIRALNSHVEIANTRSYSASMHHAPLRNVHRLYGILELTNNRPLL
jgi:hypothetical protein